MNLLLKPLVVTRSHQERVKVITKIYLNSDINTGYSSEYLRVRVASGGQNLFINKTGIFTDHFDGFNIHSRKNKDLVQYSGDLFIYNRDKINNDFLSEKNINNSIGIIYENEYEHSLIFKIYLKDEKFLSIQNDFQSKNNLNSILINFENPINNTQNNIWCNDTFSEYTLMKNNIQWTIKDKTLNNYLLINEVDFEFEKFDFFKQKFITDTENEKHNILINSLNNLKTEIAELKDLNEEKLNPLIFIRIFLFIITICIIVIIFILSNKLM